MINVFGELHVERTNLARTSGLKKANNNHHLAGKAAVPQRRLFERASGKPVNFQCFSQD
jgi:hypothetical protein